MKVEDIHDDDKDMKSEILEHKETIIKLIEDKKQKTK